MNVSFQWGPLLAHADAAELPSIPEALLKPNEAFGVPRVWWMSGEASGTFRPGAWLDLLASTKLSAGGHEPWLSGPTSEFDRRPAYIPSDPLFSSQWHNAGTPAVDINITEAWDYYTGAGIKFGVYDDGIDNDHVDLSANYDASLHVTVNGVFDDPTVYNSGDAHGTAVAGLIAARQGNGQGGVGGSFNGRLTGVDIFGPGGNAYLYGAMNEQDRFDVTNHSWGWTGAFADNRLNTSWNTFFNGIQDAVQSGRSGLGTIQMVAAGNDRTSFDNANTSNFTSSRFVNAIAAIGNDGRVSSYSNPGASLLVASPSNGASLAITTTDYTGAVGYSTGNYTSTFGGTSAATPIASGVVGLILEANPLLGYRDVMEILAISARQIGTPAAAGAGNALRPWQFNGAANWNNGGMHFSHDYGFGLIDAFAAVKLAKSWGLTQTFLNELVAQATNSVAGAVPDNAATGLSRSFDLTPQSGNPITVEAVEVEIRWSSAHTFSGDLIVTLTSPSGMQSYLLDRAGGAADLGNWVFTTRAHLGELATGVWTVTVADVDASDTGTVSSIAVRAYGSSDVSDNYYYTDEFGTVAAAAAARRTLVDTDGGVDTLNFAALSTGVQIDLNEGASSQVAGSSFVIAAGTAIENVVGTWSADTLTGNALANTILGEAGNDTIQGGAGSDTVDGGSGTDVFRIEAAWSAVTWVVTGVSVTFTYLADTLLGPDVVSNVEAFVDSNNFLRSWTDLGGAPPATPPLAPVITGFSTNSGSPTDTLTNDTTPTLTITAEIDVTSVEVFRNGLSVGFAASGGNGDFTFTSDPLANGDYTFTARATRGGLTGATSASSAISIDAVAPTVLTLNPVDNSTILNPGSNIVLTFSEAVQKAASGSINIHLAADGTIWRSIDIGSAEVTISGAQVTINPTVDLPASAALYINVTPGAFVDAAGNPYAGIAGSTAYNFTTTAANVFLGDDAANTLSGSAAGDSMFGYAGADTISGNAGDDTIDGGAGNDTLTGGANTAVGDTVSYAAAGSAITVSLASTAAQNTGGAGSDRLSGFENLIGSNFNDRLTGDNNANAISGGIGNDSITGGGGADALTGGDGADTLIGGAGADTLTGGAAADIFDFNAAAETGVSATTRDVITDFQQGLDRIDLSTIDASGSLRGNNAFLFLGNTTAFGTAPDGGIGFVQEGQYTVIYGDTDQDNAVEFQIALLGTYTLTAADFVL